MAQHDSKDSLDALDTAETLDDLEPISVRDFADSAADTVENVLSSELIHPLEADDVIELDYDEDLPTRVDGRRRQQRHESIFPPARVDEQDVFYLTDGRPSLSSIDDDVVDMSQVLLSPPALPKVELPSARDTIPPIGSPTSKMSSIAPVAMPSNDERPEAVPAKPRSQGWYGATLALLAAAAVTIAVWPTESNHAPATHTPAANVVQTSEMKITADVPEAVVLKEVAITAAPRPELEASPPDAVSVPVMPPSTPEAEVVIDDREQLEESGDQPAVDEPSAATEGESSAIEDARSAEPDDATEPETEAPEAKDEPLAAFARTEAASALAAAAGAAASCHQEGMPRTTARVSVTFAPSGRVTTATVDGASFAGSPAAGCIARTFRSARVSPFSGPTVTVHKSFQF